MFEPIETGTVETVIGGERPFPVHAPAQSQPFFGRQPAVPVMPITLVRLDLLLSQSSLDLSAITDVILSDVGASLQVLRAAAPILTETDGRVGRIDDCIVHLGRQSLRRALPQHLPPGNSRRGWAAKQLWRRAYITAKLARTIAGSFPAIHAADAYLAGLLHDIGSIPLILGWRAEGIDLTDSLTVGRTLARDWRLPPLLNPAVSSFAPHATRASTLANIVDAAASLARRIAVAQVMGEEELTDFSA